MTGQASSLAVMRNTFRWRFACLLAAVMLTSCERAPERATPTQTPVQAAAGAGDPISNDSAQVREGSVTITGDDAVAESLNWRSPVVTLAEGGAKDAYVRARRALLDDHLFEDADAAIPLYLAILRQLPGDPRATRGLAQSVDRLFKQGDAALASADDQIDALRRAHQVAAVLRTVARNDSRMLAFLQQLDLADRLWSLNSEAEVDIRAGRYGVQGGAGALGKLREVLRLRPGQPRAMQGVAAVESGLIRNAEDAAARHDFASARQWLGLAGTIRPGSPTMDDARARIERMRQQRIVQLRDAGLRALPQINGIREARDLLGEILLIATPGDPAAAELRQRIELASHYGLFGPGQRFTDSLRDGSRGPEMIVVPHGAFRMGAEPGDAAGQPYERPVRYLRFDRGFAMSTTEVTVGEFKRFLAATQTRTRAARRGYSMPYDERSNNFVRRSGVDSASDYRGGKAADNLPVVHVSAGDADAYAAWLTTQTGRSYRVPSEAEYEYALRAGSTTEYPWSRSAIPPKGVGNFTGGLDRSPGGRAWANAIRGYGDGHWGPAPVASFRANAYGLHDLSGNVSEWVADCWHDSYRRAPKDSRAWFNPGCRTRVIRGGSWASSPIQLRSAWRAPLERDTTNAQIGFRVVRDL